MAVSTTRSVAGIVVAVGVVAAVSGAIWRAREPATLAAGAPVEVSGDPRGRDDRATGRDSGSRAQGREPGPGIARPIETVRGRRGDEPDDGGDPVAAAGEGDTVVVGPTEVEALRQELATLRRDYEELREEQLELLGKPVPTPADVEPRFSGPVLTGSVTQAIGQSGVLGSTEHVDCSEYPCIVFGRLLGDEEDMEEIERAAALSPYDADVLTLLFWATTVDSSETAGPRETGLFAIAFYTADDRASMGAELDRRIRTRTVEYWNTDKPERPEAAAVD